MHFKIWIIYNLDWIIYNLKVKIKKIDRVNYFYVKMWENYYAFNNYVLFLNWKFKIETLDILSFIF